MRTVLISLLILSSNFCWCQSTTDWDKYCKFWVQDIDREEKFLISNNTDLKNLADKKVSFIIPNLPDKKLDNGNRYIIAYIANFSSDTVAISRADATMANSSTEILVDKKWLLFQKSAGSSCGNSYWTMKLAPKHYITLEIENTGNNGKIRIPFKAVIKLGSSSLESNQSYIYASKERLKTAGKPIRESHSNFHSASYLHQKSAASIYPRQKDLTKDWFAPYFY